MPPWGRSPLDLQAGPAAGQSPGSTRLTPQIVEPGQRTRMYRAVGRPRSHGGGREVSFIHRRRSRWSVDGEAAHLRLTAELAVARSEGSDAQNLPGRAVAFHQGFKVCVEDNLRAPRSPAEGRGSGDRTPRRARRKCQESGRFGGIARSNRMTLFGRASFRRARDGRSAFGNVTCLPAPDQRFAPLVRAAWRTHAGPRGRCPSWGSDAHAHRSARPATPASHCVTLSVSTTS